MPMLIPNHQSVPKSIENISKNGIDIDAVVRNSFSHAVKNSLSKFSKSTVKCIARGGFSSKPVVTPTVSSVQKPPTTEVSCKMTDIIKKECKVMPLTARNKNFQPIDRQPNSPLPRARIHQQKKMLLTEKNIKKENRGGDLSADLHKLDDSLTNLQWLTDVKVNDIMEGKAISYTPLSPAPSNCSDEGGDDKRPGRNVRYHSDSSVDYRTNSHVKPPYSYAALIIMAMKSKSCSKMTLSEIYRWITDNFVFYKHAEPSWQNSIRHNLSLNKCFAKIPRNKGDPGKGGYWSIVPEYADKLLESNIRKRRSSMLDYGCQEFIKRQRLDMFESQLLLKIKEEINSPVEEGKPIMDMNNNNNNIAYQYKNIYKHSSGQQPMATLADAEQCRQDHPYGKNPFSKFVSDEDNIKALADSLQRTSNTFVDPNTTPTSSSINFDLSNSQIFNTFSSAIRTDCIWSSEYNLGSSGNNGDMLTGSMSMVKEELLEARNLTGDGESSTLFSKGLTNSLNSSGGFTATFCLSPPLSGDDDNISDDLDDMDSSTPFEDLDLTVRGTSMPLLNPTPDMLEQQSDVKEEPLSPESIDLQSGSEE